MHGPKIDAGIGLPGIDIHLPKIGVPSLDILGPNLTKLYQISNKIYLFYINF